MIKKMLILLFLIFIINSNNSKSNNIYNSKKILVYDTIVFTSAMNGQLLNDKYKLDSKKFNYYKKYINTKNANKNIIINKKHTKTEIKYLGFINDLKNKNKYHIISQFHIFGIGQMLSPRGKSDLIVLNLETKKCLIYNFSMPDELPRYIKNNILYFERENDLFGISIYGGLPPYFCGSKIGCSGSDS